MRLENLWKESFLKTFQMPLGHVQLPKLRANHSGIAQVITRHIPQRDRQIQNYSYTAWLRTTAPMSVCKAPGFPRIVKRIRKVTMIFFAEAPNSRPQRTACFGPSPFSQRFALCKTNLQYCRTEGFSLVNSLREIKTARERPANLPTIAYPSRPPSTASSATIAPRKVAHASLTSARSLRS